jgi:hypothetical protein
VLGDFIVKIKTSKYLFFPSHVRRKERDRPAINNLPRSEEIGEAGHGLPWYTLHSDHQYKVVEVEATLAHLIKYL